MSVSSLLKDGTLFSTVPEDWYVVITDIKSSTRAVDKGFHDQVNLVATGSIIATLNIVRKRDIEIPFFFGGDGATMLIPEMLLAAVLQALTKLKENTLQNFEMDLRVGHVSVSDIYAQGFELKLSKVRMTSLFTIPVVLGGGLAYAEKLIKGADFVDNLPEMTDEDLNLDGMECRWNRVKPPENTNEVVCLLVVAQKDEEQAKVFQEVLDHIDEVYGPRDLRQPISVKRLSLRATLGKVRTEMRARLGRSTWLGMLKTWLQTLIGKFYYFPFHREGKEYLQSLVQLADTFVLDGRINTVMSGTIRQRKQLLEVLNQMEEAGDLYFGLHASAESVMSCYVRNRTNKHIHFVDGSEGGYTQAARMLKGKMR